MKNTNKVSIRSLREGDGFMYQGEPYLVLDPASIEDFEDGNVYAVNLDDNTFNWFTKDIPVEWKAIHFSIC